MLSFYLKEKKKKKKKKKTHRHSDLKRISAAFFN